VCPPSTAFDLHKVWPEMELRLVAGSGHSMYDPGITHELVLATARMKGLLPGAGRDSAGRSAAAVAGDGGVAPAVNSGGGSAAGGQQDVPGGGPRAAAIRRDMTNSSIDKQVTRGRSRRHGGH
jgi:proline iminopeptidase